MLRRTELATFLKQSKGHEYFIVFEQLLGDTITPISAAAGMIQVGYKISLLESGESVARIGRYSFLGYDPKEIFYANGLSLIHIQKEAKREHTVDPFTFLRDHRKEHQVYTEEKIPGFLGGYVGYVGYDAIRYFEDIPVSHADTLGYPDVYFEWHQKGIVFDHEKGIITLIALASGKGNRENAFYEARKEIEALKGMISRPVIPLEELNAPHPVIPDCSDDQYKDVVLRCKEYIRQGDAFQIVPSRSFVKKLHKHPFSVYRSLRLINPSPYMFYLDTLFGILFGASPEKLVSAIDGEIETIPLAGTRPRKGMANDDALAQELLSDEKELSEHTMLVDLGRNDIGKVATLGSVHVDRFASILYLSHVLHLSSIIQGKLRKDKDIFDVLRAVFPAGTLTGAPKIRAMEIIDEVEKTRRGPYGGAIVSIDALGNLDSCIAIRMAIIKEDTAYLRSGAGIVFDSIPENEVKETWAKVQVLLDAIDA